MIFKHQLRKRQAASFKGTNLHYYHSPAKPEEPPPTNASLRKKAVKLRQSLIAIILITLVAISLSVNSHPKVTADSTIYHPVSSYQQAANHEFSKLKNQNKVTLNQTAIAQALIAKFPEIDQAQVNLPAYSSTASLKLKIAAPTFTLGGAPGTYGENVKYVIAANGKVIGFDRDFPSVKNLPNLTDQSGYPIKVGELVLGKGTSSFILAIIGQCNKNGIPVATFNLPANTQEIDLKTADKPYYVKFNLAGDAATQIGQFLAARAQLTQNDEPKQYLDVRVEGRIYYK